MEYATEKDIRACFRLLLGRQPNEEENAGHFGLVGQPLPSVVSSYLGSLEFRNRGLVAPTMEVETVSVNGLSLYVAKNDSLIGRPIAKGNYEVEVVPVFLEEIGTGTVLDIGANCGYFSVLAYTHGAHEVYAFEPLERNVRLLHATQAANRMDRLHIIPAAASDVPGALEIGASFTNGIVNDIAHRSPEAALAADYACAVRIDDVVPLKSAVSVIKIDVEGHEYRALVGARRTIERWRPVIISEFGPPALEANSKRSGMDYLRLLRDSGYRISVIGAPEITSDAAILERARGIDHIDILAQSL